MTTALEWFLAGGAVFMAGAIAGFVWALRDRPLLGYPRDPEPEPSPTPDFVPGEWALYFQALTR